MIRISTNVLILGAALCAATGLRVIADDHPDAGSFMEKFHVHAVEAPADSAAEKPSDKAAGQKPSVTHHTYTTQGKTLGYTATAGFIPLKDEPDKIKANMFFVAYTLDAKATATQPATEPSTQPSTQSASSADAKSRPITFVFNGGPGSAAVWLHLGAAGPRRVTLTDTGAAPIPPGTLVNNDSSWLDATDLVFIDPVGTGYSRAITPEEGKQFYDVHGDIQSVGEFIRLYITQNRRWESPKFIAGESYGTTRAAGLADHLAQRQGINLNGVILISSVLSFQTLSPSDSNEIPFVLYLPSYAATAAFHKKLPSELLADFAKTQKEVENFAVNTYLPALAMGNTLPETARQAIAERVARYTGLSKEYVLNSKLRIYPERFEKALLAGDHKLIGRFDGTITGLTGDLISDGPEYDPSLPGYLGEYTAAFNQYIRGDLGFQNDLTYEVLSNKVHPWNFDASNSFLYTGDNLAHAMTQNPHLHLMVAAAWQDLATPYFAANYTISHLPLPDELKGNITQTYYAGGHMLYHTPGNLEKLHADVKAFMGGALAVEKK